MDTALDAKKVQPAFNDNAPAKTAGVFADAVRRTFGNDGTDQILETLKKLQIPLPTAENQFVNGHAGIMLFSNKLGVTIRIETKRTYVPDDDGFTRGIAVRADDSAWMLQPIAAVELGKAVVEILPAIHWESRDAESRKLYWKLWSDGYDYWDDRIDNVGRLPDLPGKPGSGVTVVLDRLATQNIGESALAYHRAEEVLKGENNRYKYRSPVHVEPSPLSDLRQEWDQMLEEVKKRKPNLEEADQYDKEGYNTFMKELENYWPKEQKAPDFAQPRELELAMRRALSFMSHQNAKDPVKSRETLGENDPQEILYGDLRQAFAKAWAKGAKSPDAAKMQAFWRKVRQAKEEGRMVAGWNEPGQLPDEYQYKKTGKALISAQAYDAMMENNKVLKFTPPPKARKHG